MTDSREVHQPFPCEEQEEGAAGYGGSRNVDDPLFDNDDEEDSEEDSEGEEDAEEELRLCEDLRKRVNEFEAGEEEKPSSKPKGKAAYSDSFLAPEDLLVLQREFRTTRRFFYLQFLMLEDQRRRFAAVAHSHYKERDYRVAARALAAAYVGGQHPGCREALAKMADISLSSYTKYMNILSSQTMEKMTVASLHINLVGRPEHYSSKADAMFWEWLTDEQTRLRKKTVECMIEEYEKLTGTKEVSRQHISFLLHQNGWRMTRPKNLDIKRCVAYKTLKDWYSNEQVQKLLTTVDPRLLFNADETDLNRKGSGPRWVAAQGSKQPVFVTTEHTGSHVSLFLMVSASGMPVFPFPVLHGKPAKFADVSENEFVKCYLTPKGYMTKFTFEKIMNEVFIPYVKLRRQVLGLPEDAPAVLVVDGHNSRYNPPMLQKLKNNYIDLLIIPAHSSHRMQPLDLTLNKLVKDHYKTEFRKCLKQVQGDIKMSMELELEKPAVKLARVEDTAATAAEKQKAIELNAKQKRLAMINAAVNSVQAALIYRNVVSSWRASKLCPFDGTPPFSPEQEQEEHKQIEDTGIVRKSPRSKIVRLTGVVTTDEAIRDISIAIQKRGKIKAPTHRIERPSCVGFGPVTEEIDPDDSDVENSIELEDEAVKRPRGRPRSTINHTSKSGRSRGRPSCSVIQSTALTSVRVRSRGRPRKVAIEPVSEPSVQADNPSLPRKGRGPSHALKNQARSAGRPRKLHSPHPDPPSEQHETPPTLRSGRKNRQPSPEKQKSRGVRRKSPST